MAKRKFSDNNNLADLANQGREFLTKKVKENATQLGNDLMSHGKRELEKVGNQLLERGKPVVNSLMEKGRQRATEIGKGWIDHAGKAASNFIGGMF